MSYLLFLDDRRSPADVRGLPGGRWIVARNRVQFIECIERTGLPVFVSFDYDLGGLPHGLECARWLVGYCRDGGEPLPRFNVHSTHLAGASAIGDLLRGASGRAHLDAD
ncbi:MAG: hypothetical protein NVV60_11500 [Luteimonas sp.]|nr:hypothetical protein [Luteimonas sp.]